LWTSSGTGTFANANSLTSATYAPSEEDMTAGSVALTLTATGNSPCGNATSTKTLTIAPTPTTASAGPNQTLCEVTTTTLAANTPVVGTGSWAFAPGSPGTDGIFGDASSSTSTFSGSAGSTYLLRWSITTNTCGTSESDVHIIFGQNPSLLINKQAISRCGTGADGILTGYASGAAMPYQYNLNGILQSGTGTPRDSSIFNNLTPGSYNMHVQDANGCTSNTINTNLIQVPPPTLYEAGKTTNASECNGNDGTITIGIVDNREVLKPYTYALTPPVGPPVVQRGNNTFSGLTPGTYSITAVDASGCATAKPLSVTLTRADRLTASISRITDVSCGNDGSISVDADGGVATYFYSADGEAFKTGATLNGLAAGPHTVTVMDSKGCTAPILNAVVGTAPPLQVAVQSKTKVSCMGGTDGSITVRRTSRNGGVPPYYYSIDGGTTYQGTNIFTSLTAGTYNVMLKDSKGCTSGPIATIIADGAVSCIAGSVAETVNNAATNLKFSTGNTLKVNALPNPTRTAFTLNLQSNSKEKITIIVTDMFGKKLYQTTGTASQQYVFGKEFRSGMYVVQVIQSKEIQTLKLVKGN